MAKTEFLQIRMTPENRQHLSRVAEADHLAESTWGRRAILRALERWDAEHPREQPAVGATPVGQREPRERYELRKVAESKLPSGMNPPAKQKARE